jgi:hypothetical protein
MPPDSDPLSLLGRMENDQRSLTSAINGAKSNGPTSPEGKARSARNAEKHGIYSSAVLLHHESKEEFNLLQERYYQRFHPATQPEADLVDQMIAATWRLRRITAVESAAIDHAMESQRATLDATYKVLDPETRTHLAFEKLHLDSGAMAAYQRFQAAQIRQYDRAFRNLRTLQAREEAEREVRNTRSEPTLFLTEDALIPTQSD